MTDENLILFPAEKIVHPEHTAIGLEQIEHSIEEIKNHTLHLKIGYQTRVIEAVLPYIQTQLRVMGVLFTDDDIIKAGAFVMEALKALLGYHFGIEHKFHDLIQKTIVSDDSGHLRINDWWKHE